MEQQCFYVALTGLKGGSRFQVGLTPYPIICRPVGAINNPFIYEEFEYTFYMPPRWGFISYTQGHIALKGRNILE